MALYRLSGTRTTWINVIHPTPQDIDALRRMYPYFHPLNLEDTLSPIERPKIDDGDDYLFVVMHFPLWDAAHRLTRQSEVDFFVGRGFVITLHDGALKPLRDLYDACQSQESDLKKLLDGSASHSFYAILDKLIDYCFPIMRKVDGNIRAIEERIFTDEDKALIRDIAIVRRDIISLRRIIRQQVPIMENLERIERPIIQEDLDEYFGDIVDHVHTLRDIVDEDFEIIVGLSDTADTLINHRLNGVIRVLTVISVIILPLTLVSGIYGMNVSLPLDDHPDAYLVVLGLMVVLAVSLLVYFKRRKWL
ncbi:MAG: magnesium/cobalt transporter CorA [Chloroflexota bacterium]|nr:magnesium/cobalt transporter CorA [Chloroflexota bacterium]